MRQAHYRRYQGSGKGCKGARVPPEKGGISKGAWGLHRGCEEEPKGGHSRNPIAMKKGEPGQTLGSGEQNVGM